MRCGTEPHPDVHLLLDAHASTLDRERLDALREEEARLKQSLFNATDSSSFSIDTLQQTLHLARGALNQCKHARSEIRNTTEYHQRVLFTWNEVQQRKRILQHLKAAISHVQELHSVADSVLHANSTGDFVAMAKACSLFESLSAKPRFRMEDQYKCLQSISDRVSHAVVSSMRTLRLSLRSCCTNFEEAKYQNCISNFYHLGAISHFPAYVFQAFEELASEAYSDILILEARPSQKLVTFFSKLSGLLIQFTNIVRFHAQMHQSHDENNSANFLSNTVLPNFQLLSPPFGHFALLSKKLIGDLKHSLLSEPVTALLQVIEASQSFCDLAILDKTLSFDGKKDAIFFRSKLRQTTAPSTSNLIENASVYLRRGRSETDPERMSSSSRPPRSGRQAWLHDFERPIAESMHQIAVTFLSAIHMRHSEELRIITKAPECWVRIPLTEKEIRQTIQDVLQGLEGTLQKFKEKQGLLPTSRTLTNCMDGYCSASWTFTTASLSMLRWISEYFTIGIMAPGALSEALSNVSDIFLRLVHASIDMNSRVERPEADSFLKSMQDVLLERPHSKSISDFLPPSELESFQIFLHRYSDSDSDSDHNVEAMRWNDGPKLDLQYYSQAAGSFFSNAIKTRQGSIRQCVAAEGIGTLCEVMEMFCSDIESLILKGSRLAESYEASKMASLRSAIALGKRVQDAFYQLLAWDIIGGWDAISAVTETCRSFHRTQNDERNIIASESSPYVNEMLARISNSYVSSELPPIAAEHMGRVICSTAMGVLLDGFSYMRGSSHAMAISQMLINVRVLDLGLVEITGLSPCPGRVRTELFVKAAFLRGNELLVWIEKCQRKLGLLPRHVEALLANDIDEEVPIVDQIITP